MMGFNQVLGPNLIVERECVSGPCQHDRNETVSAYIAQLAGNRSRTPPPPSGPGAHRHDGDVSNGRYPRTTSRQPKGAIARCTSPLLRCCSVSSSETRDWANLGDGPAGLIAELVLTQDVADYVRFRAVCTAWRRCAPDPRSQRCFGDSRYHPRQWLMLDKAAARPRCRRFLNLATGECIRMDLPELEEEHAVLALTAEGLVLLLHERTRAVRLLNPLTRLLTNLPPVTALLTTKWQLEGDLRKIIQVDGASTVAVSFACPSRVLVVAKPGDEHWTLVDSSSRRFLSVLPFAGRFYCATLRGVEVLDHASTSLQPETMPRLLLTAVVDWGRSLHISEMMNDSLHLVDNAGDLMLVHRMLRFTDIDTCERNWAVYKVDLDGGVLVPAKSLCGRAVFVGARRTVSVSVDAAFDVVADTLYFGYECDGDASYNLGSGEATYYSDDDDTVDGCDCDDPDEPCNHNMDCDRLEAPWDIVTCLCDSIHGTGKELA